MFSIFRSTRFEYLQLLLRGRPSSSRSRQGGIRSFTAEMGRCLTGHPEVLPAVWRYGGQRILIGTTNISSQWKAKCHRRRLQFWNWDPWLVKCMYPNCRYPICIFQLIDWVLVVGPPTSEPFDNKDLVGSFQCRTLDDRMILTSMLLATICFPVRRCQRLENLAKSS